MPMKIDEALRSLEGYIDPVDDDIVKALDVVKDGIERKDEALKDAERFIDNGVALGYIKLPEPPDSALDTLPHIRQSLTKPEE